MRSYGQFCPVAKAAEVFCERWTPLIVRDLAVRPMRFSELQRGVPLMSPTLLTKRLRQLEAEGIVERKRTDSGRGWLYQLTSSGHEFAPIIGQLGTWGQRWSRRALAEGEVDLGLLVWALERGVSPDAFGPRRNVVRLELTDQPAHKKFWWYVNQDGRTEMCVENPGFEIVLYLAASLPDMIYIWRGDLSLSRAIDSGRLEVDGATRYRRALKAWLNPHPLTTVKSQRVQAPAV